MGILLQPVAMPRGLTSWGAGVEFENPNSICTSLVCGAARPRRSAIVISDTNAVGSTTNSAGVAAKHT
jgi:hypothetical protein